MSRARATQDVFRAIADPTRRAILDRLRAGPAPVNDLAADFEQTRPAISKHLRVLREVGAVDVREAGRHRLYRLNGDALRPIHEWVAGYAQLWDERFAGLDAVLEDLRNDTTGADDDA